MSENKSANAAPRHAATRSGKTGDYDDRSGDWKDKYTPHAIYFYYRKDDDLRVYLWVNPRDEAITLEVLRAHIIHLTQNARNNGNDPRPIGWKFDDVPWWRRSYLVVAVDTTGFKFPPGKAVIIDRDDSGPNSPNHCFFDGWDGEIDIPVADGGPIQVMWTVNYMKNKSGDDIPSGKIHDFKLYFQKADHPIRRRDEGDHGTNMGPPVGPP